MIDQLILYSLISGLFSLIGGLLVLWKSLLIKDILVSLIAFGAGAFLGAAFLDILPEALEATADPQLIFMSVLLGFTAFFILERFLMRFFTPVHIHDAHAPHTESLAFLLILGDSVHNFLDGIVIAIAYTANPILGLPTALAIAAHEIPQEIGDFSILLKLKWNKFRIIGVNILQSLFTIPGVLLGYYLGQFVQPYLSIFLGLTAGIFLYIAASDLVPELHHQAGHKHFFRIILPFLASIFLILLAKKFISGH